MTRRGGPGLVPGRVGGPLELNLWQPTARDRRRVFLREHDRWTYANFLDRLAGLYRERTAFVLDTPIDYPGFSGTSLSYRDVSRLVNRMAHALRRVGVERGDRVAMITANRIEMAFCNFAAAKIGAIPVPMNFMLRPAEIDHIVQRSGAEVLICDPLVFGTNIKDPGNVPSVKRWLTVGDDAPPEPLEPIAEHMRDAPDQLDPVEPSSWDEPALLFFTSGTTGMPKGATLSHEAAVVFLRHHGRAYALRPRISPALSLLVMPVAHAGGYAAMISQLAMAMPAYFISKFDVNTIVDAFERYRPTMFSGTPAMYRMLIDAGVLERDLTSMRIWAGGADAFSDDLIRAMREAATRRGPGGIKRKPMFIRGYGMAEANSYVAQTPPFEAGDHCVGWVLPPVQYRVVDEEMRDVPRGRPGELLIRGPNVTSGYWEDPEATEHAFVDGWFRTYDIVRKGKWGMLYFVGRSNDIIKSGGYKISAAEIDQILTQHPDVEHAATVGVPDEIKGERPMSAVMLRRGSSVPEDEILTWARERIAPYKCPRRVFVMPDLPFTFSVKPKRFEVRERIVRILADEPEDA
ncbi:MAG: class I adenylate-forming enzyme family protein [Actinomycetota bacterium]